MGKKLLDTYQKNKENNIYIVRPIYKQHLRYVEFEQSKWSLDIDTKQDYDH